MKISNETKVGILTITALTLLILGFNFMKGKDLFNRSKKIYAVFSELGSLEKSNEVRINGLPIGKVYDLNAKDKDISGIVVTINLSREVNIPDNSSAYISSGLVGASFVVIEKGDSKKYLKIGDTLETQPYTTIFSDVKAQMNPTLLKVRNTLDSLSLVFGKFNRLFDAETRGNLQQAVANFNEAGNSLNKFLDPENGPLANALHNTNSIIDNLKKNNDSITAFINNAKQLSEKLSSLELQKTIDSIHSVLTQMKATIVKITNNDGTFGKLINEKEIYDNLNKTILSFEILADDIRIHPKRYFGNVLFNRKDKTGPLTTPIKKKDTIPGGGN